MDLVLYALFAVNVLFALYVGFICKHDDES